MTPTFIHLKETDSTNTWLQNYARREAPEEGLLVYTDFQTAGRGQMGNHWESEPDSNLLFSLLLRPRQLPANAQFVLSQAVALGVCDFFSGFGEGFSIKWPNDIYWHDRKIGGILIENDLEGSLVGRSYIGIGLNINQQRFYSDAPNPVSLMQITGRQHDLDDCLRRVWSAIADRYAQLTEAERLRADYLARLYQYGTDALYFDAQGVFEGRIETVEPSGHLVVRKKSGVRARYFFKEIGFIHRT
ncbi:MAG: biotin--[acetyl-CoA-carboxylase] ligase [Paludibacteraceae bacterium]|nr:biotin--[acetyl-CoA-carboxylase] ligase [Paludibacteraceae bacterium]